ncbi:MAG: Flp family type IVb pilin [Thermacetogeniaceae bacterium]|jgi:Flp pilus assembly pilin Flp
MTVKIKSLLLENSGQGLAEYSLILLFIAVAVIITLQALGGKVLDLYSSTVNEWPN